MFLIIHKQKIYSYLIAIAMIVLLFGLTANSMIVENAPTVQTVAGAKENE